MFFIGSLGWKQKEEIFIEQIKHKKVEEKYAAYRQLHPENPELDDYDVMEEEIYRWLFKTIDELPPRCKKIFLLHLDGKKQRDGGNVSFWGFKIKKINFTSPIFTPFLCLLWVVYYQINVRFFLRVSAERITDRW